MDRRDETYLTLRIDLDADPIEGRISVQAGGASRAFSGWIGLAAALEVIRKQLAREQTMSDGSPDKDSTGAETSS